MNEEQFAPRFWDASEGAKQLLTHKLLINWVKIKLFPIESDVKNFVFQKKCHSIMSANKFKTRVLQFACFLKIEEIVQKISKN